MTPKLDFKGTTFWTSDNSKNGTQYNYRQTNRKSYIVYWMASLPPTKEEVNAFARVCLLTRLLKKASMDLDEMLRVDRRRDMDELINFWALSGL